MLVCVRGGSRSTASLELITRITLTECNRSVRGSLASLKFPSLWLEPSLLCDVSYVTMDEKLSWELIHCYVTYITDWRQFVLYVLGPFILSRVAGLFIVRLKLFSKWELSNGLEFNVLCKSIASKKQSMWYELYLKKYLLAKAARALTDEPE